MHSKELFSEYEANVRSYSRSFPEIFTKAKGAKMYDENGKEYIDFFAGAGALNYGHNNDYIKEKVIDYIQSDGIMHSLDMMTAPKAEFIEFFEKKVLEPRGLDYKIMFAGPTGTNAVESLLKLARKVKKREMIWAYMGCFHGMTLGSISLTSDAASRAGAGVGLDNVYHIPAPYMFPELDTIKFMQTLLDRMDRTSMYSELEARVPFADHRIIEYVFNVPWHMKYQNGVEKTLLRDAFSDVLPPELLHRKKSPYPKTYHPGYEALLIKGMEEILDSPNAPVRTLIDTDKTREFLKAPAEYGSPWFGQLMAGPQLIAYFIQINYWMEKYQLSA